MMRYFLPFLIACTTAPKEEILFGDELGFEPTVDDTVPAETPPPVVDTDPPIDTGLDDTSEDTGVADTADPGWEREFDVLITADDEWTMYIDGQVYNSNAQGDWRISDHIIQDIQGRQRQVIAIHARDNHRVIAGLIAVVHVSTELYSVTGDGQWKMTTTQPPSDWIQPNFDDSSWGGAFTCPDTESAIWAPTHLANFLQYGAQWVWHSGTCYSLGEAWFRLVID